MDSPFAFLSTPVHLNETYGPCSPLFSSTPEMVRRHSFQHRENHANNTHYFYSLAVMVTKKIEATSKAYKVTYLNFPIFFQNFYPKSLTNAIIVLLGLTFEERSRSYLSRLQISTRSTGNRNLTRRPNFPVAEG
jgi:hypothetical protein